MYTIVILALYLSIVKADASHVLTTINDSNKDYLNRYSYTLPNGVTELPFNYNKTSRYIPAALDDSYLQSLHANTDYLFPGTPKSDYLPPKSEYLPPEGDVLSTKSQYLSSQKDNPTPSKTEYLLPKTDYLPSKNDYLKTKPEYLSPESKDLLTKVYLPPSTEYLPPKTDYLPPDYLPLKNDYLKTVSEHLPHKAKDSPKKDLLPPSIEYLPPKKEYVPPKSKDLPKKDLLPPSAEYLPPKTEYVPLNSKNLLKKDYLPPNTEYLPPKTDYLPPNRESTYKGLLPPKKDYLISNLEYSPTQSEYLPSKVDYLAPETEYLPTSTVNSLYIAPKPENSLYTTSKPYYNTLRRTTHKEQPIAIKPSSYLNEKQLQRKNLIRKFLKGSVLAPNNVNYSYPKPNVKKLSYLWPPSIDRKPPHDNDYPTDYNGKWVNENSNHLDQHEITNEKSNNYLYKNVLNHKKNSLNSIEEDSYLLSSTTAPSADYLYESSKLNYEHFPPLPLNTNTFKRVYKYSIPTPLYAVPLEQHHDRVENNNSDGYHYDKPSKEFVY